MSTFSVANTLALRNNYNSSRSFVVSSNRKDAETSELNQADSLALRRAVRALGDFDYKESSSSSTEMTLRAFVDTYNYTLDSASNSEDSNIVSDYKKLKSLTKKYASELENIGISADDKGYLTLSKSAAENIKGTTFEKYLGKDSEYTKQIAALAKKINRHVDTYI